MKAKFIYENFKRSNNDKLSSLGIGKRKLIENWLLENLKYYTFENCIIDDNFMINVNNILDLHDINIIKFPDYIQFNEVKYYVSLKNCNLISLKGCPKIINDHFICNENNITTLEGFPEYVKGEFFFQDNIKKFTEKEIRNVTKIDGKLYL